MKKLLFLCIIMSTTSFAYAMPGMEGSAPGKTSEAMGSATEKYHNMDSNKDESVDAAEFKAAYPQMTDAVFGIIDKDSKGGITMEEWMTFQTSHMQGMKEEEAAKKQSSGNMLITPPKQ